MWGQFVQQIDYNKQQDMTQNERQAKFEENLFKRLQSIDSAIQSREDRLNALERQLSIHGERITILTNSHAHIEQLADANRRDNQREHDEIKQLVERRFIPDLKGNR